MTTVVLQFALLNCTSRSPKLPSAPCVAVATGSPSRLEASEIVQVGFADTVRAKDAKTGETATDQHHVGRDADGCGHSRVLHEAKGEDDGAIARIGRHERTIRGLTAIVVELRGAHCEARAEHRN